VASYLDPKPSDIEIIEAIRYHYPLNVQRAMLNIQIKTVGEALDLLKRIELMETGNYIIKDREYNIWTKLQSS
jgi:hypothetical protein